jgi:hypothetical protein
VTYSAAGGSNPWPGAGNALDPLARMPPGDGRHLERRTETVLAAIRVWPE